MLLKTIEARSESGELLPLPLFDAPQGFIVKSIEGLDPVDAILNYTSIATVDDEQEQSSKRVKRNLVITLAYDSDYVTDTVGSLRARLYKFFMPKTQVSLRFISDGMPTVEIVGRIETMDAPLFSREPEATISIICAKSNFVALNGVQIGGNSNNVSGALTDYNYEGTIETGGLFIFRPNRSVSGFTLFSYRPDGTLQSMPFDYPMINGDTLFFNSVDLNKSAKLVRGGVTTSVLYGRAPLADWVKLYPGINKIRVDAVGGPIPWTFDYYNKYGGL